MILKRSFLLPLDASDAEIKAMIESAAGFIRMEKGVREVQTMTPNEPVQRCNIYTFYYDKVDHTLDRYQGLLQHKTDINSIDNL